MHIFEKIKAIIEDTLFHHVVLVSFFTYIIYIAFSKNLDFYVLQLVFSLAFLEAAQNMLNNRMDLEIDKLNKPRRPLPSGRLSLHESKVLITSFFLISFSLILSYFNPILFIIFLIDFLLVVFYSIKPFQLRRSITGTLLFTSHYSVFPVIYVILLTFSRLDLHLFIPVTYVFLVIYLTIILKDYEDIEGDKKFEIRSLPTVMGEERAKKVHALLFLFPFILIIFSISISISFSYFLIPLPIAIFISVKLYRAVNIKNFSKIYKLGHLLPLLSVIIFAYWVYIW